MRYIKKLCLSAAMLIVFCSSCGSREVARNIEKEIHTASPGSVAEVKAGEPVYTNMADGEALKEVQDIMSGAGIGKEHIDNVSGWIEDYNSCMGECEAFTLAGSFTRMDGNIVDYGEYPLMSSEWYRRNNRDYPDVLCRIAAFELVQDNIVTGNKIVEKDFDCYDESKSWLYSDGVILFGCEESVDEDGYKISAKEPFPMLSWNKDTISAYFTLFNPVHIKKKCSGQDMYDAIKKEWQERGITFKDSRYSLLTFWLQSGNRAAASHAAVLAGMDSGYLMFEKTNPESPYSASKFASVDEVKQYLYDMMELEYSRYGDNVGTYIILQNDKLI